ncbi:hypothetical protein MKX01_040957 [Papaver californicum]|nr:hypothetical protein MKX01_040957 [Papaver californicum]
MLANIDLRLKDIFASSEPFGNVSIVLVSDIRQLPPVFDTPLYAQGGQDLQLTGSFSYSCIYSSRLANVYTRDYTMLTMEERNNFKRDLRLFPTKFNTSSYNHQRLKELGYPVARIASKNNCETAKSANSDEAKGLQEVVLLSNGARVMLRKNLSTQYGLVNGSMGTVTDVVYSKCDFNHSNHNKLGINFGDNISTDPVTTHFVLGNHGSQKPRIDT